MKIMILQLQYCNITITILLIMVFIHIFQYYTYYPPLILVSISLRCGIKKKKWKTKLAQLILLSCFVWGAIHNFCSSIHISKLEPPFPALWRNTCRISASVNSYRNLRSLLWCHLLLQDWGLVHLEKCETRWESYLLIKCRKTSDLCLPWQWEHGVSQSSESSRWCSDHSSENSPGPLEHLPKYCLCSPEQS